MKSLVTETWTMCLQDCEQSSADERLLSGQCLVRFLTNVHYSLEWTEDEALDSEDTPFGTIFPDDFTLAVATNYNVTSTDNGTSGNLELEFVILNEIPADFILLLGSLQDVNQYLFDNGYTSPKGEGPWSTTITCNDAPSVGTFIDLDDGNDWFLDVEYLYYTTTVTEI